MISKAYLLQRIEELEERLGRVNRKTNTRGPCFRLDPFVGEPIPIPDDITIGQKVDRIMDHLGISIERVEPGLRVVVKERLRDEETGKEKS
jgi:hypothetical protein